MTFSTSRLVALTVLLSSALMFFVEFAVGKAALPRFGGTPAVWITSLLFFQIVLLAGYAWANHLTNIEFRDARAKHLFFAGALFLAQVILFQFRDNPISNEVSVFGVLVYLWCTVGPLLLVLSATAPLIQHWYAASTQTAPWWLYAVSNIGSVISLVAYPLVIEPLTGLRVQTIVICIVAGVFLLTLVFSSARLFIAAGHPQRENLRPKTREVSAWLTLSAGGSFLLSATSNTLCQDIAPTPLLWSLPLGLYLLSFALCFREGHAFKARIWVTLWILGLLFIGIDKTTSPKGPLIWSIFSYSLVQFSGSMLLHGVLFTRRPKVSALGRYYLLISTGSVLGSLIVAVAAPLILNDYFEFSIALCLISLGIAASLLPSLTQSKFVLAVACASLVSFLGAFIRADWRNRKTLQFSTRNFFGVLQVEKHFTASDEIKFALIHGSTVHGVEFQNGVKALEPSSYYARSSGLGLATALARKRNQRPLFVKALGLGIGTIASSLLPQETIHFYEINEADVALARGQGGFFRTLQNAKAETKIILGDARKQLLAETPIVQADILVVDVFSGDAIPTHLFTREAFELYARHIKPEGFLLLHISNRHLTLGPLSFALLASAGFEGRFIVDGTDNETTFTSVWVVGSRNSSDFDAFRNDEMHIVKSSAPVTEIWTDDFSTLLPVLRKPW
jgi:hypothetical protein